MKALVFHHAKKVAVEKVDDPLIQDDEDLIVKVTSTSICGTDLHIYNGLLPQKRDLILGHEFMGIVEEVGKGISHLKKGDRVIVPCILSCGNCFFCQKGLSPHCENTNPKHYGPEGHPPNSVGGGVYGYTDTYGGYEGGQAEYVRVAFAKNGPKKIDDELKDEDVLFLTDIFPTGWTAVERARLKGGETVVVFGCGPVGIMCQKSAWMQGAGRVIGIDLLDYRLEIARKAGKAETFNLNDGDIIEKIREITNGRGADVCIDAVGMEANRGTLEKLSDAIHFQAGTINAFKLCVSAVRRGGVVSVIGVYGSDYANFPFGQIFDKAISIHTGAVNLQYYLDHLLDLVKKKQVILNDIITHVLPLDQAAYAYDIFCNKECGCLKVVLKP